jgi:hypothetical protein
MQPLLSRGGIIVLALFLAACNTHGILPRDKMVEKCELPGTNAVARLYVLRGSNVTTSHSYYVTFQEGASPEKIIYHAYSSPGVSTIRCEVEAVILLGYHRKPFVLPLEWIKSELVHKPISFYKLRLESLEYKDKVVNWDGVFVPTPTPAR